LVDICPDNLLIDEINDKSKIGGIIKDYLDHKEELPDDLICGITFNRI